MGSSWKRTPNHCGCSTWDLVSATCSWKDEKFLSLAPPKKLPQCWTGNGESRSPGVLAVLTWNGVSVAVSWEKEWVIIQVLPTVAVLSSSGLSYINVSSFAPCSCYWARFISPSLQQVKCWDTESCSRDTHGSQGRGMKESQICLPKGKGACAHGIRNKEAGQSEVWGEWERSLGKGAVTVCNCLQLRQV